MAEATLTLRKADSGQIATPNTDLVTAFVDDVDGLLKLMDELGQIKPVENTAGVVALNNTGASALTTPFTAALGMMYVCDVSGGGFTATLPPADAASVDREIWFKLVGTNGGEILTVDADGSETIDVTEANVTLTLDREWLKLRSDGNGNWLQIG